MIALYNHLPTLDLHGVDREYARILITEFLQDHYQMKDERVVIVHGIGTGIIRKTTHEVLKKSSIVDEYKIDNFNVGMTIVTLRKKLDK